MSAVSSLLLWVHDYCEFMSSLSPCVLCVLDAVSFRGHSYIARYPLGEGGGQPFYRRTTARGREGVWDRLILYRAIYERPLMCVSDSLLILYFWLITSKESSQVRVTWQVISLYQYSIVKYAHWPWPCVDSVNVSSQMKLNIILQ